MASSSRGGPRRQCWNFLSLDPRISTTRLLFFCAHKKGFSNFDLLAFLFDSLGRSDAYLHFSPVILQSFQISYPPTTPPSLQYYHPCLYSSIPFGFYPPSQVVNGVFCFLHPHGIRVPTCSNHSSYHNIRVQLQFCICVYLASERERERENREAIYMYTLPMYKPRPNSGDTPSTIRPSIPGIIAHQVPHTRTCEIRGKKE